MRVRGDTGDVPLRVRTRVAGPFPACEQPALPIRDGECELGPAEVDPEPVGDEEFPTDPAG
jgi:hypothetical protein